MPWPVRGGGGDRVTIRSKLRARERGRRKAGAIGLREGRGGEVGAIYAVGLHKDNMDR